MGKDTAFTTLEDDLVKPYVDRVPDNEGTSTTAAFAEDDEEKKDDVSSISPPFVHSLWSSMTRYLSRCTSYGSPDGG